MAALRWIPLSFTALALQATLVPHLAVAGIRPDLPLIAVIMLVTARGSTAGTTGGFWIGLAQDLSNPAFLGLNALAKDSPIHLMTNRWMINPGSVGQPRDGDPPAAYAIVDIEEMTLTHYRVEYDISATQKKMDAAGLSQRLVRRLSVGH